MIVALVDPLPSSHGRLWSGVDVERFVRIPRETKADTPPRSGLMFGGKPFRRFIDPSHPF